MRIIIKEKRKMMLMMTLIVTDHQDQIFNKEEHHMNLNVAEVVEEVEA